jgi:hypothetical protein
MHWVVAAPFPGEWLVPFVPGDRHSFEIVAPPYAHDRSRPSTGLRGWSDYFAHAREAAHRATGRRRSAAGVITVFPQLALCAALWKVMTRHRIPLLAWCFNAGRLPQGMRRKVASVSLRHVDSFVVHSRGEVDSYSEWTGIPRHRFHFVPMQKPSEPVECGEDHTRPFVLAMGSAQRDYRTFFTAIKELPYRAVVVAGRHAVASLDIPGNVEVVQGITIDACHELTQRARVVVVPIDNAVTASGQVTLLDALMYGRATVATRSVGTIDYVRDGETGLLVNVHDVRAMRQAIRALWERPVLRQRIGDAAREYVQCELSDRAIGARLGRILDRLETGETEASRG